MATRRSGTGGTGSGHGPRGSGPGHAGPAPTGPRPRGPQQGAQHGAPSGRPLPAVRDPGPGTSSDPALPVRRTPERTIGLTSCSDMLEHAVTLDALQAGISGTQSPRGLCGTAVVPAPLGLAPQGSCRICRHLDRQAQRSALLPWWKRLAAALRRS